MKKSAKKRSGAKARKPARRLVPRSTGWREKRAGGAVVLISPALEKLKWAVHGFSTRKGGANKLDGARVLNLGFTEWDSPKSVEENRTVFLRALGAADRKLITLRQIHSDVIHRVDKIPEQPLSGDALITRVPGLLLGVQTADCVPIILADTKGHAVAAVHAGWRGTLARIVAKTIGRMHMEFGTHAEDICAALGPCIARCSYEVGPEVAAAFAGQFPQARDWFDVPRELRHSMVEGEIVAGEGPNPLKWLSMLPPGHDAPPPTVQLDLIAANRWQLRDAGVPEKNISDSGICTACRADLLFSHRREHGRTGRMLSAIGIL